MKMCFDQRVWILKILAVGSWPHAAPPPASLPDDHVPCKISQRVRIAFPARPLSEGIIYGEVTLMMDVDRTGQLADVLVVTHTGRDFAESALDAVKQWRFEPALHQGRPVLVRAQQAFYFSAETKAAKSPL
ncbi:MAG: TonB family protein [Verrucomicrobia bacterium]|nr:TonB family protein [Verrucomicrobiota bacterium]